MGALRKFMPFTAGAFILAWLAIAGIPPFSGFFAKDEIIAETFYVTGTTRCGSSRSSAAGLTAIYMTRETLLMFFGNERFRESEATEGLEARPRG